MQARSYGGIGVAPEISRPLETLERAGAVPVGEKRRASGAVRGRQDRRAREHGRELDELSQDLTPGNVVTAPRSDMMFVVTEYGLVNLKGKSILERAKAMISLAHPDFRDDLEREARVNGLIPISFCLGEVVEQSRVRKAGP